MKRRINPFAAILIAPTLFYALIVIVNPAGYFGQPSDELFALQHIITPYKGKATALQLLGTTLIAFGIIVSQGRRGARMASLLGTMFIWAGLMLDMRDNQLLM